MRRSSTPRNWKYALQLTLLGIAQMALATQAPAWAWLLLWSGASWFIAGLAYALDRPHIFGKKPDGTMSPWPKIALLPYLLVTWLLWLCQTRLTREAPADEILPDLWLGRRMTSKTIPQGVTLVVDLTAEFSEPADVLQGRKYLCVPALDAAAPRADLFADAVKRIVDHDGGALVHCALGHGRSATLVAGVLMAKGLAADPGEAEQMIQRCRPAAALNRLQKRFLEGIHDTMAGDR